ncbi:MAG: hypothetical protein AAB371_01335 [Patescibacteria group bacterium]
MTTAKEFIEKVKESVKNSGVDLSSGEDLSIGIMNLISLEEHLFFTFQKTQKKEYLKFLNDVREMRKELLKKIVKDPEGEVWCISKHLLAGAMRLMEVGTKYLNDGKDEEANSMFEKSYALYSMFWAINFNVIKNDDIKSEISGLDDKKSEAFSKILNQLMDCCDE